jgi:DNA-binding MarR family transcriptional regulator
VGSDDAASDSDRPLTAVELTAWRGLMYHAARLRRRLDQILAARHGLSLADYDVLVRLADAPGQRMRMAELADATRQSRSSLSSLADRLERRELIRREPTPEDGRGARAILTSAGLQTCVNAREAHDANIRAFFLEPLDPDQLGDLVDAWRALDAPTTTA